ncbi:uncharacterized protein LOC119337283 [Triticum dicoccoides]|uniref:uncharacterized protein LOC119337283 n=1 Tax=Triticum dicoccoides TaxID=85692 RepID=UPI000E7C98DB|nr:uncharacterized protein LOC119337283 [Triticum dicoccoides]
MGIVKVASGAPIAKCGYSRENEDLTQEEKLLLESFPVHDSADDCEHAKVDCELAMSGGQLCNVPYGLYDLPGLNDILSLEMWNSCLIEDDRFRLAAYLPDMDQHDLFTTMMELLSGSAMFFGSPLRGFFDRLNGGFYSPEVSRARELLMNFQRRRYYHFLKLYHDGIVWKFACMDKLWRRNLVDTSLEEKIHIWHNWIQEKLLAFADPNSSPLNARLSNIGKVEAASFAPLKRAKLIEGTSSTNWSAKYKEIVHGAKSVEISSSNSHIFHLRDVPGEKCSKPPKVVLKANADSDSLADGNAGIHPTPGLIPLPQLGVQVSTFSPYAFSQHVHNFSVNPSYPLYINTRRSSLGSSSSKSWQAEGALETYPILVKSPFGVQHAVLEDLKTCNHSAVLSGYQSAAKPITAYSNEGNDTRESLHEKNLLKNFGRPGAMVPESSPGLYTRTAVGHETNGLMKMSNPGNADIISEMLTLGASTNPPYNFPMQSETVLKQHHDGLKTKAPPFMNSATRVEGHRFPYTYTRRKPHRAVDLVDPVETPTMVGSETASGLASMANVKAKGIKL